MKKAIDRKRAALHVVNEQVKLTKPGVYVVGMLDYVKIGISDKLWERLISLQEMLPDQMVIYATLPGGRKLEAELHGRFAQYRTRGEWFKKEGFLKLWITRNCELPFNYIHVVPGFLDKRLATRPVYREIWR